MKKMQVRILLIIVFLMISPLMVLSIDAQDTESLRQRIIDLEVRIRELEDYVTRVSSEFVELSDSIETNFNDYKIGVEKSLSDYSQELHTSIEERMAGLDDKVIVLNITSKGFQRIETDSGVFLISIQKLQRINNGYRMVLHIGNPNFASFEGIKLNFRWGRKWKSNSTMLFDEWRDSLVGAEYTYNGKIDQGAWTVVNVDVTPVTTRQLEYIECSMSVDSIKLNLKKPNFN